MSTATMTASGSVVKEKRSLGMGIFFLVVALAIFGLFALNSTAEMTTTLGLNPGARTNAPRLEDWTLPTQTTLWVLAEACPPLGPAWFRWPSGQQHRWR